MEKKLNAPFVALLAAVVGLVVGGYVVAMDPIPGPPLKEVSTYSVVRESQFPSAIEVNSPGGTYPAAYTTASAECNVSDHVVGGGFEFVDAVLHSYGARPQDLLGFPSALSSQPFTNATTGAEGWRVLGALAYNGITYQRFTLRVTAVCIHEK